MFNLEQAIAEWRKQMLAAGINTPTPLEELESHLRDEIERQLKLGLDEARAFDFANKKFGAAPGIRIEFEKNEKATQARRLKRISVLLMAHALPLFSGSMVLFKVGGFSKMTPAQQLSALAALAVFYLMIWCGRASQRIFSTMHNRRMRKIIPILSMVLLVFWWIVFFNIVLPRCNFEICQLVLAILWGFVAPTGAMMGLNLGIETPAQKNTVAV